MTLFCISESTAVNPGSQDGGSPIPPNVDPTAYNLIMLDVDDLLTSPLKPLLLPPPVPEPVCELQMPALFTMARHIPSHTLWIQPIMIGWTHRLYPLILPRHRENYISSLRMTQAHRGHKLDHWVHQKNSFYTKHSRFHNHHNRCQSQHPSLNTILLWLKRLLLNNRSLNTRNGCP